MADRSDSYLIVKRGLYYRPKAQGYTGIRDYAGRYTLEEVAVHFPNRESENQDGMSFIHEDDAPEFTVACFDDLRADHLQKQRDEARAEVERLTVAHDTISGALAEATRKLIDKNAALFAIAQGDHSLDGMAGDIARAALAPEEAAAALAEFMAAGGKSLDQVKAERDEHESEVEEARQAIERGARVTDHRFKL